MILFGSPGSTAKRRFCYIGLNLLIVMIFSTNLIADDLVKDYFFKKAVEDHWPEDCGMPCNWQWLKAQAIVESSLKPDAISPAGAKGIMQFMDPTWEDMVKKEYVFEDATPFQIKPAITAGARYMADLMKVWKTDRTWSDRIKLARASYNCGLGNVLKAQEKCGDKNEYDEIINCLPDITGDHAKETVVYNAKIEIAYWQIVL